MENRGLESSNIVHEALWWNHESMQDDHRPPCTYVSEGKEDGELLKNLEALDPYGDYSDVELSNRVKKFLDKFENEISKEACKIGKPHPIPLQVKQKPQANLEPLGRS